MEEGAAPPQGKSKRMGGGGPHRHDGPVGNVALLQGLGGRGGTPSSWTCDHSPGAKVTALQQRARI